MHVEPLPMRNKIMLALVLGILAMPLWTGLSIAQTVAIQAWQPIVLTGNQPYVGLAGVGQLQRADAYLQGAQKKAPEVKSSDDTRIAQSEDSVEDEKVSLPVFKTGVPKRTVTAVVTAYNTVEWQTDASPCLAASGDNICGRDDVVACPRNVPLGTKVLINEKEYICLDRTAGKFDGRFDLSFDKDIDAARQWGVKRLSVTILQ